MYFRTENRTKDEYIGRRGGQGMYFRTENRTKDEKQRQNPGVRSARDNP